MNKPWHISVEAYHTLLEAKLVPADTELLYGFVYTKFPKVPLHSFLLDTLREILAKSELPGLLVRTQSPLTFVDSEPDPDISVVWGIAHDFRARHPTTAELVIEICITSHEYDRSKLRAYATAGVKECWLVLGPEKQIEVYSLPEVGAYTKHFVRGPGGTISSGSIPAIALDLESVFA